MSRYSEVKYTIQQPTSLIVNGLNLFGYELAKSLVEQGGYVIILDNIEFGNIPRLFTDLEDIGLVDFAGLPDLIADIRRLDYVFYLNHQSSSVNRPFTSQEFLRTSNYLNQILKLAGDFKALFTLTNSIKSHQFLLDSKGYSIHYLQSQGENYQAYSEAEFIRYSENLVGEFRSQQKLKAKIIRLGEVLGPELPLSTETALGRLIRQAIAGQNLDLKEDGLKSSYYVHILDAVYGVIKAQFSQDLPGYIYSVAYPEPITELSLAYRLQEMVPDSGEIKFIDAESPTNALELQVYKPAENLAEVGWIPKVTFNQALSQTVAYNQSLFESGQTIDNSDQVANQEEVADGLSPEELSKLGPLARLIQERKKAQEQKKYDLALGKLGERPLEDGPMDRLRRWVTKRYDSVAKQIKLLQELTLREFFTYVLLMVIMTGLFFLFFVPVVRIAYNYVSISMSAESLDQSLIDQKWGETKSTSEEVYNRINEVQSLIAQYEVVFKATSLNNTYLNTRASLQSLGQMYDAIRLISEDANSIKELGEGTSNLLVLRPSNSSILGVSANPQSVDSTFNPQLLASRAVTNEAIINSAERSFSEIDLSMLPGFLQSNLKNLFSQADSWKKLNSINRYYSKFAGLGQNKDYKLGIVVLDNLRPNFSGGEAAALGYLSFRNGDLIDAKFQPAGGAPLSNVSLSTPQNNEFRALTQGSGVSVDSAGSSTILSYLSTKDNYLDVWRKALSGYAAGEVDSVIAMKLSGLGELLKNLGTVEINQTQFTSDNFIINLNQSAGNNIGSRNSQISNLFAVLLTRLVNPGEKTIQQRVELLTNVADQGFIDTTETFGEEISGAQIAASDEISFAMFNPNSAQLTSIPTVATNIRINYQGSKSSVAMTVNITNAASPESILVCLTSNSSNLSLQNLDVERYYVFSLSNRPCALVRTGGIQQFNLTYELTTSNNTDLSLSIAPRTNMLVRYDLQVDFTNQYVLRSADPEPNRQQNSVFYSGEVYNHFRFNLNFTETNV